MRALVLFAATLVASGADLLSWSRERNTVRLRLESGAAEIEWLSTSTFRAARCASAPCTAKTWSNESIDFKIAETPEALQLATRYVRLEVTKAGALLHTTNARGRTLYREISPSRWAVVPGERLFGLGIRPVAALDLRGQLVPASIPLLVSSEGFGLFFTTPERPVLDLAKSNTAEAALTGAVSPVEFFCYYGPSLKEVLEEHLKVREWSDGILPQHVGIMTENTLPEFATPMPGGANLVARIQHAAFSGILAPAVDLSTWSGPEELAVWMPLLVATRADERTERIARSRRRWAPYLWTYLLEARDRGFPVIRPLAMQYYGDRETSAHTADFALGDELIVSPGASARRVYLPMGRWTEWEDDVEYAGKKIVEIGKERPVLFARNGSVVPVGAFGSDAPMELHYFPKLAAEFFLYEPDNGLTSQFHAAPAGDWMRLEIEPKVRRGYEWVAHHMTPVTMVMIGETALRPAASRAALKDLTWFYDSGARRLHVRLPASGTDVVVNVAFESPPW
ncbi:MAG: hypothetical protein ACRD44_03055 [Bryobacteraceae bacterium]